MTATVEFILLTSDLDPSSGQDVFHGSAIELGEFPVEFTIREESFPEGIECGLLVAKRNRDLLSVEAFYVVVKWFAATL